MSAALANLRTATRRGQGLQPARIDRDLSQIAELIELCFAGRLDSGGRNAIREMKAMGRLGILLLPLALLDSALRLGIATGYVWRANDRVVGNASLYRAGDHPFLGPGWLVANVAVHPDYRRQGIARQLMNETLALAGRRRGDWVCLQVDAGDPAPIALYESLGFERQDRMSQWEAGMVYPAWEGQKPLSGEVRLRQPGEIGKEIDLIFNRARPGAMAWTRPVTRLDVADTLSGFAAYDITGRREHWVLPDPAHPDRFAGVLWVQSAGGQKLTMTLFQDQMVSDPAVRTELLRFALRLKADRYRLARLETNDVGEVSQELLVRAGFAEKRRFISMRREI
nr:GNAT family N-acetyltransferase [Anaerolineae bacterium]